MKVAMQTQVSNYLRALERGKALNILTAPTHERYETNLCKTGHNFYGFRGQGIKEWSKKYCDPPSNYIVLDIDKGIQQLPKHITFDLVLSQNKFTQYHQLAQIAQAFNIPLVSLEHTVPPPNSEEWTFGRSQMRGHSNVFISYDSINRWMFSPDDPSVKVIYHHVDSNVFMKMKDAGDRRQMILTVANDFVNRDVFLNFHGWNRITNGLPRKVVGDTPGLSVPAKSTADLVMEYNNARIYINTSTYSPIPMSLLEAMSCGCAVVSMATCAIPEFVINGYNGVISNDEKALRMACEELLMNPSKATFLGNNARKTILEKCSEDRFISEWNNVFESVLIR